MPAAIHAMPKITRRIPPPMLAMKPIRRTMPAASRRRTGFRPFSAIFRKGETSVV